MVDCSGINKTNEIAILDLVKWMQCGSQRSNPFFFRSLWKWTLNWFRSEHVRYKYTPFAVRSDSKYRYNEHGTTAASHVNSVDSWLLRLHGLYYIDIIRIRDISFYSGRYLLNSKHVMLHVSIASVVYSLKNLHFIAFYPVDQLFQHIVKFMSPNQVISFDSYTRVNL